MTSVTPQPPPDAALALSPSRRGWRLGLYAAAALLLAAVAAWVGTHPQPLETSGTTVRASTPVGQPVFLGVFATPADFDRTLHLSGVRVFATATVTVTITPHVCHGGSLNVTAAPETFCADLGPTEGATLRAGDEIVLEVTGEEAGAVEIDRVRVAYRDGVQWGTHDAGARSQVVLLER